LSVYTVWCQWQCLTDCWCAFNWSICNQNTHFIRCIQSTSFQGCEGIRK
jgi:hypothetical protein